MRPTAPLTPNNLRELGNQIEFVWGDYTASDIILQATQAGKELAKLADLIEKAYPGREFHDDNDE